MIPLRAFVAHSFLERDKIVVQAFLDYLTTLSKSGLDFDWEHAQAAEPTELANKVLALIAGKNVFIAICTRSERAVASEKLSPLLLRPNFLKASSTDFVWKTSDWIIQEIGLARGRDLKCILLIENQVRRPGGLQGDVEYIEFDRSAPERSFPKINQMIGAISPKAYAQGVSSPGTKPAAPEEDTKTEGASDHWRTPKPDWNRGMYEIALMHMSAMHDAEGFNKISDTYLATEDGRRDHNRKGWEAFKEYVRLTFGKDGDLARLKALASAHPDSSQTQEYLAAAYLHYRDNEKSAAAYETAASLAPNDEERMRLLRLAAVAFIRAGLSQKAKLAVAKMKASSEQSPAGESKVKSELQILQTLRTIAELTEDRNLALAAMERVVELEPSDVDTRFSLAYAHSQEDGRDLALFHYLCIPEQERSGVTWNNLGVAFEGLKMSSKAVGAYRDGKRMGETLAMSNLAKKFLSQGFLPEAQEECDAAVKVPEYHQNIIGDLARLRELPEEEDKQQEEVLQKAKAKSEFFKRLGKAISQPDLEALEGKWSGPVCVLDVTLNNGLLIAVGEYELPSAVGLGSLFAPNAGMVSAKTSERVRVRYEGKVQGRGTIATVTRQRDRKMPTSLLGISGDEDTKALMFLDDEGTEINVMEMPSGSDRRLYKLNKNPGLSTGAL